MGLNKTHAQRKGNTMFQLRRILLSGLVALLMVGMVTATESIGFQDEGEEIERSYFGTSGKAGCVDTNAWECVHLEFFIDINIPW